MTSAPDDLPAVDPRWRAALGDAVSRIVRRLKDQASSAYYRPSGHGSPWDSVKTAAEVAETVVGAATGSTWSEFCDTVVAKLADRRERFGASDFADPDGYVCNALREFIAEVERAKALGYEETVLRGAAAPPATEPQPPATAGMPRGFLIAYVVLALVPVLVFVLFWAMQR